MNDMPIQINHLPEPYHSQPVLPQTPVKSPKDDQNDLFKSIGNFFKKSINVNSSLSRDVDYRKLTFINCIRKLFEEARAANYLEING